MQWTTSQLIDLNNIRRITAEAFLLYQSIYQKVYYVSQHHFNKIKLYMHQVTMFSQLFF